MKYIVRGFIASRQTFFQWKGEEGTIPDLSPYVEAQFCEPISTFISLRHGECVAENKIVNIHTNDVFCWIDGRKDFQNGAFLVEPKSVESDIPKVG